MAHTYSRWPVTAVFFLNGLLLSCYIVRLPALKAGLALTTAELGLVGTLFGGAAIVAMQFVGTIAARIGSARLIRLALLLMPVSVAAIGFSRTLVQFAAAAMATGMIHGTLDVAMNAYAIAVEHAGGRPILSGCHAAWSISAVTASLLGAALVRAGVSTALHLAAGAVVVGVAGCAVRLVPVASGVRTASRARTARTPGSEAGPAPGRWTRTDVLFGLTGTTLMVCEGAALSWAGVFLHDVRSASLATASLAVTAYTGSQTVGRTFGDRLRRRYGQGLLFRFGGLLGAAALACAVLVPDSTAALIGIGVAGLATSNMIPMAFSAAGRTRDAADAAISVSRFTTFTYSGILLGPALIGWIAQGAGLTATLLGLVPLMGGVALAGLAGRSVPKGVPQAAPEPAAEAGVRATPV